MEHLLVMALALGSGLTGGVFFAFSTFVMPALNGLPRLQAVAAMQAVSTHAVKPAFMILFFGTTLLATLGLVVAIRQIEGHARLGLAAMIFLVGAFLVTVLGNVPLNKGLARAIDAEAWSRKSLTAS